MRKYLFIMFAAIAIGFFAPQQTQAQWTYYPYGGYYYYDPFYSWPVTVYDPVRARQMTVLDSIEKLNKASTRLMNAAEANNTEEIAKRSKDVVKYSERLRDSLTDGDAPDAEPGYFNREISATSARQSAREIDQLVKEVNSSNIDVSQSINYANLQDTLTRLREIESRAREIENLYDRD